MQPKRPEISAPIEGLVSGKGAVFAAVERDLARLPDHLSESALAASALTLARDLDNPENSATSHSHCARALNETIRALRDQAPPDRKRGRP